MPLTKRVWTGGKIVVLLGALIATYVVFAAVSMRLALKAREVTVPDLVNRTANDAKAAVGALGLTLKVDELKRPDAKIAPDRVVAQDPPAGSVARRQRSIKVWLSFGARSATVPALVGESERSARLRLAQEGLAVAAVSEIRSADYPTDAVVAQEPAAKSPAAPVTLLVNRGTPNAVFVMPDLIGLNGDRVADLLRERGFRVAVVGATPYPGVAAGVVLRQNPQAGFQIGPGEPISLEVSR
jgi:beta-lactam-binding protein with PASTA domain